jgi:predicted dehydrogenase
LANLNALAAICDPSPEVRAWAEARFPGVRCYAQLADALAATTLNAAIVASDAGRHTALAQTCLAAGLHVLVEKPLALTVCDAEAVVRAAMQAGRVLAVGHLLMYHPALKALKTLMDSGEMGDILSVDCTRLNFGRVRNEENVWWSLASHDLSILSLLLDAPLLPVTVSAQTLLGRPGLEDEVTATFQTLEADKQLAPRWASIHVGWLHPVRRRLVVVKGTKKMAVFDDFQPNETKVTLLDYALEASADGLVTGMSRGEFRYMPYEPEGDLLEQEALAFLKAVAANDASGLPNNGWNGLENVRMLEAVTQAMGPLPAIASGGQPLRGVGPTSLPAMQQGRPRG